MYFTDSVERWGVFEFSYSDEIDGNPFTDYSVKGFFKSENETQNVNGFYDGDGTYRVRFMPKFEGIYSFTITGNSNVIFSGSFKVIPPAADNHGPVLVSDTFNFSYSDGTPYYCVGTTCYVWHLQSDILITQTLNSLRNSPFNKLRFCIFPKHYDYNLSEPRSYPYEGTPVDSSGITKENFQKYTNNFTGNSWNFTLFNTDYFRHLDYCIFELQKLGIEADLILMHPYDRWGFSNMGRNNDRLYIEYITARFSAFRNVWWALANEYDLMPYKNTDDWEFLAEMLVKNDPYNHLRSIHNCIGFYDHSRPWITHCSIQRQDLYKSSELTCDWRNQYQKPIVLDEIAYEGNISHGWGNISAKELVRRFWEAACRGGYAGHGETYLNKNDILWWSHGGILHGESPERIAFLKDLFSQLPDKKVIPTPALWDEICCTSTDGFIRIYYYSFMQPSSREYHFDDCSDYTVDIIDTWNMTITPAGTYQGRFIINLPGRQFMAVRITKCYVY